MTSSESEGHAPLKKRARTRSSAGEAGGAVTKEGSKARGRPRVDTQDATAADVSALTRSRTPSLA